MKIDGYVLGISFLDHKNLETKKQMMKTKMMRMIFSIELKISCNGNPTPLFFA